MNVLEKILKEIEEMRDIMKSTVATNCFGKECKFEDCTVCVCERVIEIIRSHMNHNSDDTEMDDWIPCSKYLPEVPEGIEDDYCPEFNVTIKGADKATTLKYAPDGTWFDDSGEVYNVIAWQPLPKPYKGE